jgi:hypothetical protein
MELEIEYTLLKVLLQMCNLFSLTGVGAVDGAEAEGFPAWDAGAVPHDDDGYGAS